MCFARFFGCVACGLDAVESFWWLHTTRNHTEHVRAPESLLTVSSDVRTLTSLGPERVL